MGVVEVLDPVQPARTGGWKVDVSRGERNGRVSSEWFNRPDDERYLSFDALWANVNAYNFRLMCLQIGCPQTGKLSSSTATVRMLDQMANEVETEGAGSGNLVQGEGFI